MIKKVTRNMKKTNLMSFRTVNVKLPENLYEDIKEISNLTGISMNAIYNVSLS